MNNLLFVSHFPLSTSITNASKSSRSRRRGRVFVLPVTSCTSASPSQPPEQNEPGDPDWMGLAKSFAPPEALDDDKPTRAGPQWTYPQGEVTGEGDKNAWELWNSTKQNDDKNEQVEMRNPQADTDFWRNTARDLSVSKPPAHPEIESDPAEPAELMEDQTQVWGMARNVTEDMTNLQDELLAELNEYDPMQKSSDYRDAAREIVQDQTFENQVDIEAEAEAEAGSGWNPDVDWMRFDDVNRDTKRAEEALQRKSIEEEARKSMYQQQNEQVVDYQQDSEQTGADFTVDGKMPGFLTNKMRNNGTYGGSRFGADNKAQELVEEGYDLRDPKSDTEAWKSVAKDIIKDVPINEDETQVQVQIEDYKDEGEDEDSDYSALINDTSNEGESNSNSSGAWSTWYQGSIKWNQANSKIKERDPKQEVDMWRSSARDLLQGKGDETADSNKNDNRSASPSTSTASPSIPEDSNVWTQWQQASDRWESSVSIDSPDTNDENLAGQFTTGSGNSKPDISLDSDKKDWGAGLGKTNSERNAWESWNRLGVMNNKNDGSDKTMWWNSRWDGNNNNDDDSSELMNGFPTAESINNRVQGEKRERLENNSFVDEWRSIAKQISNDNGNGNDSDSDSDNEEEKEQAQAQE